MNWAEEHDYLVDGSSNGAVYKHGARTANAMKARGCAPGRPDLLVLESGADGSPGLAVELKIGSNKLSDAPLGDWGLGHVTLICRAPKVHATVQHYIIIGIQ